MVMHHGLRVMSEQVLFERMGGNFVIPYPVHSIAMHLMHLLTILQHWSNTAAFIDREVDVIDLS